MKGLLAGLLIGAVLGAASLALATPGSQRGWQDRWQVNSHALCMALKETQRTLAREQNDFFVFRVKGCPLNGRVYLGQGN